MRMRVNEFQQPVSVDSVPRGSLCEWCGKPAVRQLTAIGGKHHNDRGVFCSVCGESFLAHVLSSLQATALAHLPPRYIEI